MGSPVWGLRPTRALRADFFSRPSPGRTKTPFFLVSFTAISERVLRNIPAPLLLVSIFSARSRTRAVLVKPAAIGYSSLKTRRAKRLDPAHINSAVLPSTIVFPLILCGFSTGLCVLGCVYAYFRTGLSLSGVLRAVSARRVLPTLCRYNGRARIRDGLGERMEQVWIALG